MFLSISFISTELSPVSKIEISGFSGISISSIEMFIPSRIALPIFAYLPVIGNITAILFAILISLVSIYISSL